MDAMTAAEPSIRSQPRSVQARRLNGSPNRSAANSNCIVTACLAPCMKPRTPCKRLICAPGAASTASSRSFDGGIVSRMALPDRHQRLPQCACQPQARAALAARPAGACHRPRGDAEGRARRPTWRGSSLTRIQTWKGIADDAPNPEARYTSREAVQLAFVAAIQQLPPRQRAVAPAVRCARLGCR